MRAAARHGATAPPDIKQNIRRLHARIQVIAGGDARQCVDRASANRVYPSMPLSILVPFAPGGGHDNVSCNISTRLPRTPGRNSRSTTAPVQAPILATRRRVVRSLINVEMNHIPYKGSGPA
uniref:hypothetical protein n=1 Tax=Cupriavidus taiwanensis TaxID=164546 RepID=UPI0013317D9A|nr:hypothetical protein [Cupriavidus taiwanensis]